MKGRINNNPLKSRAENTIKKLYNELLYIDNINDKNQRNIFLRVKKTFENLPQDLYDHIVDTHFANYVKNQHGIIVNFMLKLKEIEDSLFKPEKKINELNNYNDEKFF